MPPKRKTKPKKKAVTQKQKQSQRVSQKVTVNVGTVPRRRGRKPRAVPRPLSYQQPTTRVLAQFATPFGMPQQFNPTPTIMPVPQPQPFRPEVSQAQTNRPNLVEVLNRTRPIPAVAPTMRAEAEKMGIEDIRSAIMRRREAFANRPKRNANLDDTPQEAAEIPVGLAQPSPLGNRGVSDITTAPNTPYLDPFAEEDEETVLGF